VTPSPPFWGTISIDPDIITPDDPTAFLDVSYVGQASRRMFDRRVDGEITVNAHRFTVRYDDGTSVEVQVNPEFSFSAAAGMAEKYGRALGQLPAVLRSRVAILTIHGGVEPFAGGSNFVLIHTGQALAYEADGILEETLVHEASHTSLDPAHASAPNWIAAQEADGSFISIYARDHPRREDVAESFLPYLAVQYRADRISDSLRETILTTIPNRIEYFDSLSFDMRPIGGDP